MVRTLMRTSGLAVGLFLAGAAGSAQAVVYCTAVGVPRGCVVRPAPVVVVPPPVVVVPGAPAVRAVTPGVGAPGVGVRPGAAVNLGGPVNRRGVR
ncbi:hypothetical protein [Polymorphum gilvum]|uniref:Uncharacterized protein n=1 Tax=Polymorphum gilvum (strain LMG 25793 / CGMCC 1.9160 / SL003B-26A1) TaxID=991905 RepID=F2IY43_POLGS|nr:hypothetical protein [Polymorphum gilvum]ADZ70546.1 hypothetical protein SL003B_2121 [Polymorphum gilvum SL003B-26A1]